MLLICHDPSKADIEAFGCTAARNSRTYPVDIEWNVDRSGEKLGLRFPVVAYVEGEFNELAAWEAAGAECHPVERECEDVSRGTLTLDKDKEEDDE